MAKRKSKNRQRQQTSNRAAEGSNWQRACLRQASYELRKLRRQEADWRLRAEQAEQLVEVFKTHNAKIQEDNSCLRATFHRLSCAAEGAGRQDEEVNRLRSLAGDMARENDRLRRRLWEAGVELT